MQTKIKKRVIQLIETSILVLIWIIVFASPILFSTNNTEEVNWKRIFFHWGRLSPFLLLSFFNHFALVPLFLFKKSISRYLLAAIIILVAFNSYLYMRQKHKNEPLSQGTAQNEFRPPPPHHAREVFRQHPPHIQSGQNRRHPQRQVPGMFPPALNAAITSILILGFDTGLRTIFKWSRSEEEKKLLENEKIKSELAFLRNQVSPHFLMNTLNNIHGLVDIDSELAKETVISLSKLMRYLLYDTERDLIPIKEELNFVESYVELMKMRISDKVKVDLSTNVPDREEKIPPLLFINFIENAFKYGISYRKETFIDIHFSVKERMLVFKISNSIAQQPKEKSFYSGIGLENTKKRLDIIYQNNYNLDISSENDIFSVTLKLPL